MDVKEMEEQLRRNNEELQRLRSHVDKIEKNENNRTEARQWLSCLCQPATPLKELDDTGEGVWLHFIEFLTKCPDNKVAALKKSPPFVTSYLRAIQAGLSGSPEKPFTCPEPLATIVCRLFNHVHVTDARWINGFLVAHPKILPALLNPHVIGPRASADIVEWLRTICVTGVMDAQWVLAQNVLSDLLQVDVKSTGGSLHILQSFANTIERLLTYPDTQFFVSGPMTIPPIPVTEQTIEKLLESLTVLIPSDFTEKGKSSVPSLGKNTGKNEEISDENLEHLTAILNLLVWLMRADKVRLLEASEAKAAENAGSAPPSTLTSSAPSSGGMLVDITLRVAEFEASNDGPLKVIFDTYFHDATKGKRKSFLFMIASVLDVVTQVLVAPNVTPHQKEVIFSRWILTGIISLTKLKLDFINSRFLRMFGYVFDHEKDLLLKLMDNQIRGSRLLLSLNACLESAEEDQRKDKNAPPPVHLNSFIELLLCSEHFLPCCKQLKEVIPQRIKDKIAPTLKRRKKELEDEARIRQFSKAGAVSLDNVDGEVA